MPRPVAGAPQDRVELYERLIATQPGVARKGASVPYTACNGNMFSYLSKEGKLALRLPEPARSEFLKKYRAVLCRAYGIVQKEYVEVPAALLKKTSELQAYFAISCAYAGSLKPKRTTARRK